MKYYYIIFMGGGNVQKVPKNTSRDHIKQIMIYSYFYNYLLNKIIIFCFSCLISNDIDKGLL